MNGATSTTNVAAVLRLPPNNSTSPPPSGGRRTERKAADSGKEGALAAAQAAVSRTLGESGFVDITAPFMESLTVGRNLPPIQEEIGDLKPGALEDLVSALRRQIATNAERSVQSQARVRPDAAVTLLT
jgi:hypothetical protein